MSEIPAGATKPQDHKKSSAQIEAEGIETVTVTWRDQEFILPATIEDCPVEVAEAFEDGKGARAVAGILGADRYAAFKKKNKPTVRDLNDLARVIAEAMGMTPGE